jgi:HPt (histidine-containing phosphotransfer) domain-containing protein
VIESGDPKLAERIAHTVKGVAGNIGLGQVLAAAEKLEKTIHRRGVVDPALLEEFNQVLSCKWQTILLVRLTLRQVFLTVSDRTDFGPQTRSKQKRVPGFK